jgi:hypothetical protein
VTLDPLLVADLDTALEEATVQDLAWDTVRRQVEVQVRVLSLAADGTTDADRHRVLCCSGVSQARILLRRDRLGAIPYGPVVPLPDLAALRDFLASTTTRDAMYGGRALDDDSPVDDWPASVSFSLDVPGGAAPHCLYWFTDCTREEPGGIVGYRLEGLVRFTELEVRRADGAATDLRSFADDGMRWWAARMNNDPRVASRAGRELIGLSWGG